MNPLIKASIPILFTLLITTTAQAQIVNEDYKFLPNDPAQESRFGNAIDIDDNIIIIGADEDPHNGFASGAAYLFDAQTGKQLFKLVPDDGSVGDFFGHSVAIEGHIAIVGAPGAESDGFNVGAAYLFDTTTGQQIAKLIPADANWQSKDFGSSVDIQAPYAVVGARFDDNGGTSSGAVYLYDINTATQIRKIRAPGINPGLMLGASVSLNGNLLLAGAPYDRVARFNGGSAYLFNINTGFALARFISPDAAVDDAFGFDVNLTDDTVLIGMRRLLGAAGQTSGGVYLFDLDSRDFITKIVPPQAATGDYFGSAISTDGNFAVFGSYGDNEPNTDTGSAYLYDLTTLEQIAKLTPSQTTSKDNFGFAAAISGNKVVIGAPQSDDIGPNSGSAFLYTLPCPPDLNDDGILDFFDISTLLAYFVSNNPEADFTNDGVVDFFDISFFLTAFAQGCP